MVDAETKECSSLGTHSQWSSILWTVYQDSRPEGGWGKSIVSPTAAYHPFFYFQKKPKPFLTKSSCVKKKFAFKICRIASFNTASAPWHHSLFAGCWMIPGNGKPPWKPSLCKSKEKPNRCAVGQSTRIKESIREEPSEEENGHTNKNQWHHDYISFPLSLTFTFIRPPCQMIPIPIYHLITRDLGRVKLLDFGCSSWLGK